MVTDRTKRLEIIQIEAEVGPNLAGNYVIDVQILSLAELPLAASAELATAIAAFKSRVPGSLPFPGRQEARRGDELIGPAVRIPSSVALPLRGLAQVLVTADISRRNIL